MSIRKKYTDKERELAVKFNLTPENIRSISKIYDFICRFACIRTHAELKQTIMEEYYSETYTYKELPNKLKDLISAYMKKESTYGRSRNLSTFFSPDLKKHKLDAFVAKLVMTRVCPTEYYVDGIITYRGNKREPKNDFTYEYEEIGYKRNELDKLEFAS